jgi:hypothetical protein
LEAQLAAQVDRLEVQLQDAQNKFQQLSAREEASTSEVGGADRPAPGTDDKINMLDAMVRGGMLRGMFQLAMDENKMVAKKAKQRITRFLKFGTGVLPFTADEANSGLNTPGSSGSA